MTTEQGVGISVVDELIKEFEGPRLKDVVEVSGVKRTYRDRFFDGRYEFYIAPKIPIHDPGELSLWMRKVLLTDDFAYEMILPEWLPDDRSTMKVGEFRMVEEARLKITNLDAPDEDILGRYLIPNRILRPIQDEDLGEGNVWFLDREVEVVVYPHVIFSQVAAWHIQPYTNSQMIREIQSGYIRKQWMDRLGRGQNPFTLEPSLWQKALSSFSRGDRNEPS